MDECLNICFSWLADEKGVDCGVGCGCFVGFFVGAG